MRVLVWIVEETWQATVAASATFAPADAEITLLYVRASDAEEMARGGRYGLLGRPLHPHTERLNSISEQSANELLADARTLLGREAVLDVRTGRLEDEVAAAAQTNDLLVLARDKDRGHRGPKSLGPTVRHIVDHSLCAVLIVWPDRSAGDNEPKG
jgi:nucleotide-binding universal stress UspA family protein